MAGTPMTDFRPSPTRLEPLRECMGFPRETAAEWPANILSRRTVVYGSGVIARRGDPVRHRVDPDELALCTKLSKAAERAAADIESGLDSEGDLSFRGFFIAANVDDVPPVRIDGTLIRARFGGTIFPPTPIVVEPLAEGTDWWREVLETLEGLEHHLVPWRELVRWFRGRAEFTDTAFVAVGGGGSMREIGEDRLPEGTEMIGSAFPRLVLGLTRNGSLAGLFGHVVQT